MLWNDSYETGVDEIDRQNVDLITYIEAMMSTEDNKAKLRQLEIFIQLVKKFFEHEQSLHNRCSYFRVDEHRISHESYIRKLRRMKREFVEMGSSRDNNIIFNKNVVEFLKNHITRHDELFARFYHDKIFYENIAMYGNAYGTVAVSV